MRANYAKDPALFPRCMDLIEEVFPGCKEFARYGEKYNASWKEASTPFIVEKKGEIIAHTGVWPITFILNGKEHRTASIHGVCVKPEHRGKGYFKQLMNEAMEYVNEQFDSSLLFTVKPYLYLHYPYQIMLPEYDFVVNEISSGSKIDSDLRLLNLDNPDDLKLMHELISNRVPLSNQLSVQGKNGKSLFILNMMNKPIFYSKKLNALLVYEIKSKSLFIKEIISPQQTDLQDIIGLISEPFDKIILQFCPDRFLDRKDYSPILAMPECCIMVSESFIFKGDNFRFPELYWC